jgi:hypothetical protein
MAIFRRGAWAVFAAGCVAGLVLTFGVAGTPRIAQAQTARISLADLVARIETLEAENDALQEKLARVSVENGGADLVITGANLHLRSGSGATWGAVNGTGNLIVGYREISNISGSHNVVVGVNHRVTSYGGIVVGGSNSITAPYTSVTGGSNNAASGLFASVSGGEFNHAKGDYASVSGGYANVASDKTASVSGGEFNSADGEYASVSGGYSNVASGQNASVSGGHSNTAAGAYSTVSGGSDRTVDGPLDWRAGDLFEGD